MSIKGRSEGAAAPLLKNASSAPFVFFDNAPLYGTAGMGIEVELTATAIVPKEGGAVKRESICVAHLRCSPQAAIALVDSLQKAITMYQKNMSDLARQAAEQAAGMEQPDKAKAA